jgi:Ring finger domain
MTIPALSNWCPDCSEACHDHPTMCTVCGATLTCPPQATRPSYPASRVSTSSVSLVPDTLSQEVRRSGQELRNWLSNLNSRINAIRTEQNELRQQLGDNVAAWQEIPPTLFDPQFQTSRSKNTATSAAILSALHRTEFASESTLFQQCILEIEAVHDLIDDDGNIITNYKRSIPAVPGEFCKWPKSNRIGIGRNDDQQILQSHRQRISNLTLVVADFPVTGEGGVLSEDTLQKIRTILQQHRSHVALYMNRGGGLTFVQKAMLAQKHGASVCVIGNHLQDGPWPYTMCDSTGEANTLGLSIPTVMVSQPHGQLIQKMYAKQQKQNSNAVTCTLIVQPNETECCICTEAYCQGNTIIKIQPGCGHYFHETCAVTWLSRHNTCPFCRYELPYEDDGHERHRLTQQRTNNSSNTPGDYYG